ncbi:MAG: aminotransferase class IV [Bryobacteraceae bacterium]
MIHPLLLHNGHVCPSTDLFLSPGQVGLMNGWGVFSTIKIVDGVLFAFDHHWARMHRDAGLLRVPFPWKPAELEEMLLTLIEANRDFNATLRVAVVRNRGTIWEGPAAALDVDLIAFTAERNDWGAEARLTIVPNARFAAGPFAGAKILSWAMNLVWYEDAHRAGFDEALLLNERGEVSECTSANVFAVFGDTVATPPLSSGCLPGVTRELLLDEIRAPGVALVERPLTLADLEAADELFITSSTRDLLGVREVDGLSIRTDTRVCTALKQAFTAFESAYVQRAVRRASRAETAS